MMTGTKQNGGGNNTAAKIIMTAENQVRRVRVTQTAVIEVPAATSDDEIARKLVFAFYSEETGLTLLDGDPGFEVIDYHKTRVEPAEDDKEVPN